ncbi:chorismate mutase [Methanobrevibacter sp. 87.7]|uniref:prephenate dehydratase n=1 Tax=Methanobrevibacter sp. 87.7 TaxID=387957 RepID=UPI000B50CBE1|nr:prephenate dehydratase [Methanobrevibacter sp. 87.7]OWT32682.1 chorismate mutase [Methanobrevibacter sp. 87.7]
MIKDIAFLGPEGTFTHEVASKISNDLLACDSINHVMDAVISGKCSKGVVPIENSIEGSVNIILDLLVHSYDLMIEKEIIYPINHNLLAPKGVELKDITDVFSHPQALAQCHNYLIEHNIKPHQTLSTAIASKKINNFKNSASIGTLKSAKIYGLNVVEKNIQDVDNNETRFVVISNHDSRPSSNDKTSIVFSLYDDKPGGLYEILSIFANNHINLSKIESRPSKQGLGKYIFFIDMYGHRKNEKISEILNEVRNNTSFFKILGSYPVFES